MSEAAKDYTQRDFLEAFNKRVLGHRVPTCPFCGNNNYLTPPQMANIFVSNNFQGIQIGPTVPCAMLVCKQCGHVDFFALGILGLLPAKKQEEGGNDNDK